MYGIATSCVGTVRWASLLLLYGYVHCCRCVVAALFTQRCVCKQQYETSLPGPQHAATVLCCFLPFHFVFRHVFASIGQHLNTSIQKRISYNFMQNTCIVIRYDLQAFRMRSHRSDTFSAVCPTRLASTDSCRSERDCTILRSIVWFFAHGRHSMLKWIASVHTQPHRYHSVIIFHLLLLFVTTTIQFMSI